MRLAVLCSLCALGLVACSSSSKQSLKHVDGGSGNAGAAGGAGVGGGSGTGGNSGTGGSTPAPPKWPDSATINCTDGTQSNVACPADGAAYFGQDGNFEIGEPSYTNDSGELTDSVTGLVWRAGSGDVDQAQAAADCTGFGGQWRLPSFLELASLMDYGSDGNPFPSVVYSGKLHVWTSTISAVPTAHWSFSGIDGQPHLQGSNVPLGTVCVSGPALTGALGIQAGGIVEDTRTGLYWQTNTVVDKTWQEALSHCLNASGPELPTGWRLPSVKELLTIAKTDSFESIDTSVFDTTAIVWSSTPLVTDGTRAWAANFKAFTFAPTEITATARVRCVHSAK